MTDAPTDPRAVSTYRIPAPSLRAGDLVNTAGRDDQDWQRVHAVHTQDSAPAESAEIRQLLDAIADRYVLVEMSDITPVDSGVYFADGVALLAGEDPDSDLPVTEALSAADASRIYLYTVHELVTIRSA